jgi:putative FmdB family regulatory protein
MPLYEYQCESCAHRFERIQKYSDPLIETCPSCGGKVKKLLSSPAIQFKGSGFYITDYAKKSKSSDDKSSNAGKESGEGSKGTATESTTKDSNKDSNKDSKESPAAAPAKPPSSKTD